MRSLVVIADDSDAVRAIRLALRHLAGFRVVATLDGRASARARLAELGPDVVLIDEMCQRSNAFARIREAVDAAPEAHVLLLAACIEAKLLEQGFEAGADAVISRALAPATLGTLLREVVLGSVVHAPRLLERSAPRAGGLRVARSAQSVPDARTMA